MTFQVGDRVRVADTERVGPDFVGLYGTIAKELDFSKYLVSFDDPPKRFDGDRPTQGGEWSESVLEAVVTEEEIQAAIQSILGDQHDRRSAS